MAFVGFEKLRIHGWRQFRSVEIELHPRLTIITGANGAGKSTLLSFFIRHFGYNKNYLATPLKTKDGKTSFSFGLFKVISGAIDRLTKGVSDINPGGLEIGTIEYTNGKIAKLNVPAGQALNYSIGIEGQQGVEGLHIDSHRPPNIYRHVGQFSATPPLTSPWRAIYVMATRATITAMIPQHHKIVWSTLT